MAVASSMTTKRPTYFRVAQEVYAEDLKEIANAQNWVITERVVKHLSLTCGTDGWDDYPASSAGGGGAGNSLAVGTLKMVADGTTRDMIVTDLWVDEDATNANWESGAECDCAASNEITVTFELIGTLGTNSTTVVCDDTDNDTEQTGTPGISAATAGGEWVQCTIKVVRSSGAASTNEVRTIRLNEATYVATSIPDPVND